MVVLNVFFKVKPECTEKFLSELGNMVSESNKEDGCNEYRLWKCESESNLYALIESWRDKQVLFEHQKTPHWQHFNNVVNSYLLEPYSEYHYTETPR